MSTTNLDASGYVSTTNLYVNGTSFGNAFVQGGNSFGATGTLGTNDANNLSFETNNTSRLTILSGGNVGIGTVNPTSHLYIKDLNGISSNTDEVTLDAGGFSAINKEIRIKFKNNATDLSYIGTALQTGSTDSYLSFGTSNGGITEKMRIDKDGNVGINTDYPNWFRLQVAGNVGPSSTNSYDLGSASSSWRDVYASGTANLAKVAISAGNYAAPSLFFATDTDTGISSPALGNLDISTDGALRVRISSGGFQVGPTLYATGNNTTDIGRADISWKDIYASGTARLGSVSTTNLDATGYVSTTNLFVSGGGSGNVFVQGGNSFSTTGTLGTKDANNLNFITNNTSRLTVLSSGNVGVGTVNPAYGLDINGSTNISRGNKYLYAGNEVALPGDEDLYAYYAFDEGSGTVASDGSGNGNDGTITATSSVAGKVGKALDFSTTGNSVTLPSPGFGKTGYSTISFWFKRGGSATWKAVANQPSSNIHHIMIDATFQFGYWNTTMNTTGYVVPNDSTYHHYVVVFNSSSTYTLYVDGVYYSQIALNIALDTNPITVIGGGLGYNVGGPLDEFRMYNRALTEAEIKSLYLYPAGNKGVKMNARQLTGDLMVNASGNVGIGTINPSWFKLQVAGSVGPSSTNAYDLGSASSSWRDIYASGTASIANVSSTNIYASGYVSTTNLFVSGGGSGNVFVQGGNSFSTTGTLGTKDANNLNFITNNTSRLTVLSSGNVGVGTVNPAYGLDINGSTNISRGNKYLYAGNEVALPGDEDLYAYYAFDEGSGTVASDGSGNGNDGTITATSSVAGKVGKALDFSTTGNSVTLPSPGFGKTGYSTISFWFKRGGSATWKAVANQPSSNIHHIMIDATFQFGYWNTTMNTTGYVVPNDSTYHHYVVVFNSSSTYTLYVDGVYYSQIALNIALDTNPITVIGGGLGYNVGGPLDEFRMYNRALTEAEIKSLYLYPAGNKGVKMNARQLTGDLMVNASGNVGIGTINPSWFKLQVAGSVGPSSTNAYDLGSASSSWRDIYASGTASIANVSSTNIYASGYVSTTNLFVSGGGSGNVFVQGGNSFGTAGTLGTKDANSLNLITNNTSRMTILSDGKVGIGTTPAATLDVRTADAGVGTRTLVGIFGRTGAAPDATERAAGFVFSDGNNPTFTAGIAGIRQNSNADYNGALGFYVNNGGAAATLSGLTEVMRINNSGNVGIGTVNPSWFRLQVAGHVGPSSTNAYDLGSSTYRWRSLFANNVSSTNIDASGYVSTTNLYVNGLSLGNSFVQGGNSFGTTGTLGTNDANNLTFETNNASRLTILSGGNVGIGTVNPSYPLQVVGQTKLMPAGNKFITVNEITSSVLPDFSVGSVGLAFSRPSDGVDGISGIYNYATAGADQRLVMASRGDVILAAGGTSNYVNSPEVMRIAATGNVGIGATVPANRLTLTASGALTSDADLGFNVTSTDGGTQSWTIGADKSDQGKFKISSSTALGTSDRLTINGKGYVGIGTAIPNSLFNVYAAETVGTNRVLANIEGQPANSGGSSILRVTNNTSYTTDLEQNAGGTGPFRYGTYVDTNIVNSYNASSGAFGNINFVTGNAGGLAVAMTIGGGTQKGNVGIGTASPGAKLDIQLATVVAPLTAADEGLRLSTSAPSTSNTTHKSSPYLQLLGGIWNGTVNTSRGFTQQVTGISGTNYGYRLSIGSTDFADALSITGLSGNIGIGTTAPLTKLHVYGVTNASPANGISLQTDNTAGSYTGLFFKTTTDATANYFKAGLFYTSAAEGAGRSDLLLGVRTSNDSTSATPSNSTGLLVQGTTGNIGIGTATPIAQTEIYGTGQTVAGLTDAGSRGGMLMLNTNGSAAGDGGALVFGNVQSRAANSIGFAAIKGYLTSGSANTYGDLTFSTRNDWTDVALTERLRISAAGNVGIGTTPGYLLDVAGSSQFGTLAAAYTARFPTTDVTAIGTTPNIWVGARGNINDLAQIGMGYLAGVNPPVIIGHKETAVDGNTKGSIFFATRDVTTDTAPTERMTITSAGYVGIGSTAPSSFKLQVLGDVGPDTTATYNLGSSSLRWKDLYTSGGIYASGTSMLNVGNPVTDLSAVNRGYVLSRGMNLVTNGSGLMGSNYNFSSFTYSQNEVHGGLGSFLHDGAYVSKFSDELIPVDVSKYYRMVGWAKHGDTGGVDYDPTNRQYAGVVAFDIDGNAVTPDNSVKYPGSTDTTLTAQLNPGDTVMHVANATGWLNTGCLYYSCAFSWWPYTNSKGYTWPNYTYTRNESINYAAYVATSTWHDGGISSNNITLSSAWPGPALATGTAVRNLYSGSTYKYITASYTNVPNDWTRYEGFIGGVDELSTQDANRFFWGTAYVKLMFLPNYVGTGKIRWSDLWLSEMSSNNLEVATALWPGVVSTSTQTFAGTKTFNGWVGFGASPSTPLHVQSTSEGAKIDLLTIKNGGSSADTGESIIFRNVYRNARITAYSSPPSAYGGKLQLQTHGGANDTDNPADWNTGIYMDNAGAVGIGTTALASGAKLHVYTAGMNEILSEGNGGADYVEGEFRAKSNAAGRGAGYFTTINGSVNWFMGNPYSSTDSFMIGRNSGAFDRTTAQTSNAFLTMTNAGDVGIGVVTAGAKLQVNKSSTYNNEGTGGFKIEDGTSAVAMVMGADVANNNFYIQSLDPGTGYTTRPLSLNPNGANVGVGTIAPRSKLGVVSGTANTDADIAGQAASFVGSTQAGQGSTVSIESNDEMAADTGGILAFGGRYITANTNYANWAAIKGLKADAGNGTYGGYMSFYTRLTGGGSLERMRIDTGGNIGINATTPSNFKLQVGGNVGPNANNTYDLGSGTSSWQNIYASGTVYGGDALFSGNVTSTKNNLALYSTSTDRFFRMNMLADGTATLQATAGLTISSILSSAVQFGNNVIPVGNNSKDLGVFGTAWRGIYASGTVIGNQFLAGRGTLAAPAFSFASETNSGMYTDPSYFYLVKGGSLIYAADSATYQYNYRTMLAGNNNAYDLGMNTGFAWRNIYASGTAYLGDARINGKTVCLGDGTNCITGGSTLLAVTTNGNFTNLPIGVAGVSTTGSIIPTTTLTYDLGTSGARFRDVWASSTYIGTSTWQLWQSNEGFTVTDYNASNRYMVLGNDSNFTIKIGQNAALNNLGSFVTAVGTGALGSANTASYITAVGYQALGANTSGERNSAFGTQSMFSNSVGSRNSAFGELSLSSNTSGADNTGMGYAANFYNKTGSNNTAVGSYAFLGSMTNSHDRGTAVGAYAGYKLSTGADNTGVGFESLYNGTTAYQNTALGSDTLYTNATGYDNVAVGYKALYTGTDRANTAIGARAMQLTTTGNFNTAVGADSLNKNTTGSLNTALGEEAMNANTVGHDNLAVGVLASFSNRTGIYNTALGSNALYGATANSHSYNTAVGASSMLAITTGSTNTAVGFQSAYSNTTGFFNVAYGSNALYSNQTGNYNTAIGSGALLSNTGSDNTALGVSALYTNTSGNFNLAAGESALYLSQTGTQNVALGYAAMRGSATTPYASSYNTAVGYGTMQQIGDSANYNSALGNSALATLTTGYNNTAIGYKSLYTNSSGNNNIAIGYSAATATNIGTDNVAIGSNALQSNTTQSYNVAIGSNALYMNTASLNTAVGDGAMYANTSGYQNTALGAGAMYANTTGYYNTGIGAFSMNHNTIGLYNTAVGFNSLYTNVNGHYNTVLGEAAMYWNVSASYNVGLGYTALNNNTTGDGNVAVGVSALYKNTTGAANVAVGRSALTNNVSATNTIAIGYSAGAGTAAYSAQNNIMIGVNAGGEIGNGANDNTYVGHYAGNKGAVGINNTAIGSVSAYYNVSGSNNTAMGYASMFYNISATNTVAIGANAGTGPSPFSNQQGVYIGTQAGNRLIAGSDDNSFVGFQAGYANTSGADNTAIGSLAFDANTTGSLNVAMGYQALGAAVTGTHNIAIGASALGAERGLYNIGIGGNALVSATWGNFNTGMGYAAGQTVSTGGSNTFLGYQADVATGKGTITNATAIGANATVSTSSYAYIGSGQTVGGSSPWQNFSDSRLKENIGDDALGLSFIRLLTPHHYNYTATSSMSNTGGMIQDGFIAQEVEGAMNQLGVTFSGLVTPAESGSWYSLSYASFVVPLTNAVKELDLRTDKFFQGVEIDAAYATGTAFLKIDATGNLALPPLAQASSSMPAVDSHLFTFTGSAWDGAANQALETKFNLFNHTVSPTSSYFTVTNASGTALLTLSNLGDASITGDLTVGRRLYLGSKTTGLGSASTYIYVDDTLSPTSTYIATNADGWQTSSTYDYSERYASNQELTPGDLVTADPAGVNKVMRTTASNQPVLGIVSTRPGFVTGAYAKGTYPIALAGRVPTRVSSKNGAIRVGDYLTGSDISGVAIKATGAGSVVGVALEEYSGAEEGLISVFVKPGYMAGITPAGTSAGLTTTAETAVSSAQTTEVSGLALVKVGASEVHVSYASIQAYPMVYASPAGPAGNWWIANRSDTGFDIKLAAPASIDIEFTWMVKPMKQGTVRYVSDNTYAAVDNLSGNSIGPMPPSTPTAPATPTSTDTTTSTPPIIDTPTTTSTTDTTTSTTP
ncbi:MAG: LamG-like jellyroll fold domain-containing protein [Patescibacteria group bacterium]